jgi:hypothetical protein
VSPCHLCIGIGRQDVAAALRAAYLNVQTPEGGSISRAVVAARMEGRNSRFQSGELEDVWEVRQFWSAPVL